MTIETNYPIHISGDTLNRVLERLGFPTHEGGLYRKHIYTRTADYLGELNSRETWAELRKRGYVCDCYDLPGGCDPDEDYWYDKEN